MKEIECKEVIISSLLVRGKGTELSPYRRVTQVFSKEGEQIAENDPSPETFTLFDLIHFANWCLEHNAVDEKDVKEWLKELRNESR